MRRLEETLRQMVQAAKAIGNTELENKFNEGKYATHTRGDTSSLGILKERQFYTCLSDLDLCQKTFYVCH